MTTALAKQNHNITFLSADVSKNPPPNVQYLYMNGIYDALYSGDDQRLLEMAESNIFAEMYDYNGFCEITCDGN